MALILLLAAWWLGADAAVKLNKPHPTPTAWFKAAITGVLLFGAFIVYAARGDD